MLRLFSEALCRKTAMGEGYLVIVAVARTLRDGRIAVGPRSARNSATCLSGYVTLQ